MPYVRGGTTNITGGLTTVRYQVFGQAGDRLDAVNRVVVITDGPDPSDTGSLQMIVNSLQSDGVTMMSVGITGGISDNTLRVIASQPKQVGHIIFIHSGYFYSASSS